MLLAASATYKFCVSKIYLELGCGVVQVDWAGLLPRWATVSLIGTLPFEKRHCGEERDSRSMSDQYLHQSIVIAEFTFFSKLSGIIFINTPFWLGKIKMMLISTSHCRWQDLKLLILSQKTLTRLCVLTIRKRTKCQKTYVISFAQF